MIGAQANGWWPDWSLFGDSIVVGFGLALLLPLFGALLVLRQQIFVAAAIGQAATFGFAAALACGYGAAHALDHAHAHGHGLVIAVGIAAAAATAVVALRAMSAGQSTLEARSAWIFLFGGSAAMVLLNDVPHGPQAVQRLFLSSLVTVEPHDVAIVASAAPLLLLLAWPRRRRLLLWAIDPLTAAAHGASLWRLDLLVGALLGAAIGYAIFTTGLVFTFGAAVLPVLVARSVAPSLRAALWSAPAIGALGLAAAFALAHHHDLPLGPVFTALLGVVTLAARALRRR